MPPDPIDVDLLRSILDAEDTFVRGQRWQNPEIEVRKDAPEPYYFIRPYVPVLTEKGLERKRKPIKLGFLKETSKRQAEKAKQHVMATINAGKYCVQAQIEFNSIIEKFLKASVPALASTTQVKVKSHITKHIQPAFGALRMCDIDRIAVAEWLRSKEQSGLHHNTIVDLQKSLGEIFSFARDNQLFEGENPCRRQKIGGKPAREKTLPTRDGLIKFLNSIRDCSIISAEDARLIALTAIATGARISEILGLGPSHVDVSTETIRIERRWARGNLGPVKTASSRRLRQAPGLAVELRRLAERKRDQGISDFLFATQKGNPPDDRELQEYCFRPAARRAGIYSTGFGIHRFRHLNISWRQEHGATPYEAQKAAGHSSPSMTWHYTQIDSERERTHVAGILESIGYGEPKTVQ